MELLLNVLWVTIALASLCVWRMRWAGQPRERKHESWRQWTAFVCALILLFFIVSLTDDLHAELVVLEECSAGRRHTACLACPHHAPENHADGNVCEPPAAPSFAQVLAPIGFVTSERETQRTLFRSGQSVGRAPPVVFL
jgi:hypothetical protein